MPTLLTVSEPLTKLDIGSKLNSVKKTYFLTIFCYRIIPLIYHYR